jgi:hypothetical protein
MLPKKEKLLSWVQKDAAIFSGDPQSKVSLYPTSLALDPVIFHSTLLSIGKPESFHRSLCHLFYTDVLGNTFQFRTCPVI